MLNIIPKILLVLTSLSPAIFILAVNQFERCKWLFGGIWMAVAFALTVICWRMLKYFAKKASESPIYIKEFESKDQEILTYLFIYLLPFIKSDNPTFASNWITGICSLAIIIVFIAHVGAFHYNPVMHILGYRFYAVKNAHGVSNLLISNKKIPRPDKKLQTVKIAENIYLYTEDKNVQRL